MWRCRVIRINYLKKKLCTYSCEFITLRLFGNGTVGAVAVSKSGKVAMATSTGGTTGKAPGRLGDTPIPGK